MSTKSNGKNDGSGFDDIDDAFFSSGENDDWTAPAVPAPAGDPSKAAASPPPFVRPASAAAQAQRVAEAEESARAAAQAQRVAEAEAEESARAAAERDAVEAAEAARLASLEQVGGADRIAEDDAFARMVAETSASARPVPVLDPLGEERTETLPFLTEETETVMVIEPVEGGVPPGVETRRFRGAVGALVRAAERATVGERGVLFLEAVRLARMEGMGAAEALGLLDGGGTPAQDPAGWWRERASLQAELGNVAAMRESLEGLATVTQGVASAEALVGAADAAFAMGRAEAGIANLRRALAAAPDDVTVLERLTELAGRRGDLDAQASLLERLAALHTGAVAARYHVTRARAYAQLAGPTAAETVGAWKSARAADPGDTEVLVALDAALAGAPAPRAALWESEGARLQGNAAATAWARAARIRHGQLRDDDGAVTAWKAALAAAPTADGLRREFDVFCAQTRRLPDLADALRAEADATEGSVRSFALWRLGRTHEALGNVPDALSAYADAAADPSAAPAAEAVMRIFQQQERWSDLVIFLDERLSRLSDPGVMVTVLYRMGETCEGPLRDVTGARRHYARVLEVAPGYLPALEGLERVCSTLEDWPELAAVYEQRALLADAPQQAALHRQRAGSVYEVRMADMGRAREQYRLALEAVPDFPPSLDAYARALGQLEDWSTLAKVLRTAASATKDGNEAVSLFYRSARVLADRTSDIDGAIDALQRCLELSPGFQPGMLLRKELAARTGDWEAYARCERAQAEFGEDGSRRWWRLGAAADAQVGTADHEARALVDEVLAENPSEHTAASIAQRLALAAGDAPAFARVVARLAEAADPSQRARWCTRAAELALEVGDVAGASRWLAELSGVGGDTSCRPLALALAAQGCVDDATRVLEACGLGTSGEVLRLRVAAQGLGPALVAELRTSVLGGDLAACQLAIELGAPADLRARAHACIAESVTGTARATASVRAAEAFEEGADVESARRAWETAFDADPRPGRAFDAVVAALAAEGDADGIRAAFVRVPAVASRLGDALAAAGDTDGARAAWDTERASSSVALPWQLRTEAALESAGKMQDLFDTLRARMVTADDVTREELSARCRELLGGPLAGTDEAWESYRALHAADPTDRSVLEALARIAGARGEENLALTYLTQLGKTDAPATDLARWQRQLAEMYARKGDTAGARAALLRALDVQPDDRAALASLRALLESERDWNALAAVHARESALVEGPERIALLAERARVTEAHLGDARVAIEAWDGVLELDPGHTGALERLVALTESVGEWVAFVDHARALSGGVAGAEGAVLLRRAGLVLVERLRRDDEGLRALDTAAAQGDLPAAQAVERLLTGKGQWERAVAAGRRLAGMSAGSEAVEALARAARIAHETLKDKALAGTVYADLLGIAPDHPDALQFSTEVAIEAGDQVRALPLLESLETHQKVRDLDDFDTQVEVALYYHRFGNALLAAGRTTDAVTRFERSLALNPAYVSTLEAIGPLYIATADWKGAERVYQKLLQLTAGLGDNEQLGRVYGNLGRVEHKLGQTEKARKRLAKALELNSSDVNALRAYAEVLWDAQDWNNLLNVYNNVIYCTADRDEVVDAYIRKGHVLDIAMGFEPRAAQHYEKGLAFDPAQPDALVRLGELALRRQDWAAAADFTIRGLAVEGLGQRLRGAFLAVQAVAASGVQDTSGFETFGMQAAAADAAYAGAADAETLHAAVREVLKAGPRLSG